MIDHNHKLNKIVITLECTSSKYVLCFMYRPRREETCLWGLGNNKGTDQYTRRHSLISAIVLRFSMIF